MSERRVDGFFYGLFMDAAVLRAAGVEPQKPRHAYVDGFDLQIGQRATLVSQPGSRAYGMAFSLSHAELDRLYSATGLEDYRPEAVMANTINGDAFPALCFNLPVAPAPEDKNPQYAEKLRDVLERLGFPEAYVSSVA